MQHPFEHAYANGGLCPRQSRHTPRVQLQRYTTNEGNAWGMDSPRSAKRRKLSEPHDVPEKDAESWPSASSAKATWKLLKAKSEAEKREKLRSRKGNTYTHNEEDVYEDSEGAHGFVELGSSAAERLQGTLTGNEEVDTTMGSSPGAGIFKRFARRKDEYSGDDGASDDSDDIHVIQSVKSGADHDVGHDTPLRLSARSRRPTAKAAETLSITRRNTAHREILEDQIVDEQVAVPRNADETAGTSVSELQKTRRKKIVQESKLFDESNRPQQKFQRMKKDAGHPQHKKLAKSDPGGVAEQELQAVGGSQEPYHIEIDESVSAGRNALSVSKTSRNASLPKSQRTGSPMTTAIIDEPLFEPEELQAIQHVLFKKLTGDCPPTLTHLEDEYAKVADMLTQTIAAGESNSMLLIGARGSGKTALVNQVLREHTIEYSNDFLVVHLNGFIHTDDKIALRDIWRQLGREMELEQGEGTTKNYADTLTSLLALLSHPAETGQEQHPGQVSKSVIFILDEFDLFANHPRQTLLYNLFDIAQSRKAPIAVLGLTAKVDVAESLEKRVKSRFSHRYVHLSLSESYPAFTSACQSALTLQDSSLSSEPDLNINISSGSKRDDQSKQKPCLTTDSIAKWNQHVLARLESTEAYRKHLNRIYYTSKSVPDFLASMCVPMATLPHLQPSRPSTIVSYLVSTLSSLALHPDSKISLLISLSILQLALLICACRLNAIHGTETITFALAYEEYRSIASKAKVQATASGSSASARISSKEVARLAWSELLESGLIMETDGRRGEGTGRVDVALEEIGAAGMDLGEWGRWCRQI
nr:origin recognition complex subunit 4 [Quercus suber]